MNNHFLGVDIGSSFTKFVVIDSNNSFLYNKVIDTLNRKRQEKQDTLEEIFSKFKIKYTCATGYGREHLKCADFTKTEINCASISVSALYPKEKTIIDIGCEDIKLIKSGADGEIIDFYMNDKCAAGTGSFITEIAERAEIDIYKMSELAAKSNFDKELNSFCTVFAKTEVMKWIFDEIPVKDIARGVYISIVNRIAKLTVDNTLPIYLVGGVAEYHPYLKDVMEDIFKQKVYIIKNPQFAVSYGAALIAKDSYIKNT